jgi:hypothetical protein
VDCSLTRCRQPVNQPHEMDLSIFRVEDFRAPHLGRWQTAAIDAINANGWQPNKKQHVEEFSKLIDSLVVAENETYFCNEMFAILHFAEQDDRLHSISAPHGDSCSWIFDERTQKETGLLEWLGSNDGQNVFWLTGESLLKSMGNLRIVSDRRLQESRALVKAHL